MKRYGIVFGLVLPLLIIGSAQAQEFPGLGVGDLMQWNMQQDAQFHNWAWQGSWDVARQMPDSVTPSQIIGAMLPYTVDQMYGGHNDAWWQNSQRQLDAVERWDQGAIRGNAPYYDSSGNGYYLPYTNDAYHYGNDGYIYPGESQGYGWDLYPGW